MACLSVIDTDGAHIAVLRARTAADTFVTDGDFQTIQAGVNLIQGGLWYNFIVAEGTATVTAEAACDHLVFILEHKVVIVQAGAGNRGHEAILHGTIDVRDGLLGADAGTQQGRSIESRFAEKETCNIMGVFLAVVPGTTGTDFETVNIGRTLGDLFHYGRRQGG
jgi:hypothetical protein